MASNDYRVISSWRARGRLDEVADILADPASWQRWWPAAFLRVAECGPGREAHVGRWVAVHSKGWLPYTLRLSAKVDECNYPNSCKLVVSGDFEGSCFCRLTQRGDMVELVFDWQVRVRKPIVSGLSWALKPVFVANHKWVMRCGQRSLSIELRRRRAESLGLGARGGLPPQPTFPYGSRYVWFRRLGERLGLRWFEPQDLV